MSSSSLWLLPVLLVTGVAAAEEVPMLTRKKPSCCTAAKMVTRTYSVAELVVPESRAAGDHQKDSGGWKPKAAAAPNNALPKKVAADRADATQEDALMKLIVKTIAPKSWSEH